MLMADDDQRWAGYGSRPRPDEAFEPLPGLARFPGWAWRRLPAWARAALGLAVAAGAIGIVASLPGIRSSKESAAEKAAAATANARARIAADQRPRRTLLRQHEPVTAQVEAAILHDARARARAGRLDGPVTGVACTPAARAGFRCHADTPSFSYPFQAVVADGTVTWCRRDPPSIAD